MKQKKTYVKPSIETISIFPHSAYARGLTPAAKIAQKKVKRAKAAKVLQRLAKRGKLR